MNELKQHVANVEFCHLVDGLEPLIRNNADILTDKELSLSNHLSKIQLLFEQRGMHVSPVDFKKAIKLFNRLHYLEMKRLRKVNKELKSFYYGDLPF